MSKNGCATLFFYLGLDNFLLSIYQTRFEFIYKLIFFKDKSQNHIFHKFLVENVPKIKNVQPFSWELCFLNILQTLVLLDHVYSDCLQNVATNTKNKPFSGFGPWPIMDAGGVRSSVVYERPLLADVGLTNTDGSVAPHE